MYGSGGQDRCALVGVRATTGSRFLVANLRDEAADIRFDVEADAVTIEVLDETTAATVDVLGNDHPGNGVQPTAGRTLALLLRPYAVACIDIAPSSQPTGGVA